MEFVINARTEKRLNGCMALFGVDQPLPCPAKYQWLDKAFKEQAESRLRGKDEKH